MLQKLSISNYALIDNLEISFGSGLNILTGETGAGKSIILGALSLILGQRAESRYFFNQQKKCVIEGFFKIGTFHLKQFFEDNDLDYEAETVLRREISADGKSRSFVNDTPVNLNQLKAIGEKLIDIHSQHATREINDPAFQLEVVDAVAGHLNLLAEYQSNFKNFKNSEADLKNLLETSEKAKGDLDYYQFLYDELEKANLVAGEQEQLEQDLYNLNNAGEIKQSLSAALYLMQDSEPAAIKQLREAGQQLSSLEKFNRGAAELLQRLNSTVIELKDIAAEIETIEQLTQTDEARAQELNNRLSLIYNLQKKHRVNTISELIRLQEQFSQSIQQAVFSDEAIEKLKKIIQGQVKELLEIAARLSQNRKKIIPQIEKYVLGTLNAMGMGNAALKIELFEESESRKVRKSESETQENLAAKLTKNGVDEVKFLFTANKGHALAEMSRVASGGELSRLMLSIKSHMAQNTSLPTIIFDEIDTGVSGEIAKKVGQVMEKLAANMQVITITHLPQIASKGQSHYYVYKDDEGKVTRTNIKQLDAQERIVEIAKMLSGDKPGESAIQNARELLAL